MRTEVAKTPAWAEQVCGVPAETIIDLARRYVSATPTALLPGLSVQRTLGGEEAVRLAIALQVASGNLGRARRLLGRLRLGRVAHAPGGLLACTHQPRPRVGPCLSLARRHSGGPCGWLPQRHPGHLQCGWQLYLAGRRCAEKHPRFRKVEFSVCHDHFMTPTARYCDIVLPTTTWLEREDIVFPQRQLSCSILIAPCRPLAEARDDYGIFCDLADRLGFGDAFSEDKDEAAWLHSFLAASEIADVDTFKATGIYWGCDQDRVGLADFLANPQAHPLSTSSGKVELASSAYACPPSGGGRGYPAVPTARIAPPTEQYPLRLITPKSRYRIHSQNSNVPWFREREAQALWMHPRDAHSRGIGDGQEVLVTSAQGRVSIVARVTEDIMPGVVCLLEGVWPSLDTEGTDTAGSANVLTSTEPTQPSQSSRTHSVAVQVAPKPDHSQSG